MEAAGCRLQVAASPDTKHAVCRAWNAVTRLGLRGALRSSGFGGGGWVHRPPPHPAGRPVSRLKTPQMPALQLLHEPHQRPPRPRSRPRPWPLQLPLKNPSNPPRWTACSRFARRIRAVPAVCLTGASSAAPQAPDCLHREHLGGSLSRTVEGFRSSFLGSRKQLSMPRWPNCPGAVSCALLTVVYICSRVAPAAPRAPGDHGWPMAWE